MFNLRRDPFERANFNSQVYWNWLIDHAYLLYGAQAVVKAQIDDFVKYPPRQKAASFNLDTVMEQLKPAMAAEKEKEAASKQKGPSEKKAA
jgi:arylsulfatase